MTLETKISSGSSEQINAIRANDEKVLNQLYLENYRSVEQYVLQNNGNYEEAKDIYQEAFVAVWRNIQMDRFQLKEAASLNGYLFRIAKYKWLDHLRSAGFRKMVALNGQAEPAEKDSLPEFEDQQIDQLKKYVEQLGASCRDVLKRFYYKRESLRTIAVALDWTEATARNNKYRCLQKLKELFLTTKHG